MDDSDPCQKLITAARNHPPDARVPYYFEKRVMARLAGMTVPDPLAAWGQALMRAAVCCFALTVLVAVGSVLLPARNPETLPQAVQRALLAGVDTGIDQIGDTP